MRYQCVRLGNKILIFRLGCIRSIGLLDCLLLCLGLVVLPHHKGIGNRTNHKTQNQEQRRAGNDCRKVHFLENAFLFPLLPADITRVEGIKHLGLLFGAGNRLHIHIQELRKHALFGGIFGSCRFLRSSLPLLLHFDIRKLRQLQSNLLFLFRRLIRLLVAILVLPLIVLTIIVLPLIRLFVGSIVGLWFILCRVIQVILRRIWVIVLGHPVVIEAFTKPLLSRIVIFFGILCILRSMVKMEFLCCVLIL